MIVAVLNILLPLLAALFTIAGIVFMMRAIKSRTDSSRIPYNVGKLEIHHSMQVNLIRSIACFVVALILIGVFGLTPKGTTAVPAPTPTIPATASATAVSSPTVTSTSQPSINATPTETIEVSATPTTPITPTIAPSPTTALPRTATVTSEVGVWLRAAPSTSGEQLEWLLAGAQLIVLEGTTNADAYQWQEVQTESGLTGWVAVDFITLNDQ